ncbi:hypothetical protein BYT27DRAFT_7094978 [Phlegmacium glaucopus]|nr:hypothetical protein BYT27DRAFT_7094978 [Phlegmacium glaucopus]
MPSDCTCQSNCGACGPSGTGCSCSKGKCDCAQCPNNKAQDKAHTDKCVCSATSDTCGCTTSDKACDCT